MATGAATMVGSNAPTIGANFKAPTEPVIPAPPAPTPDKTQW